MFALARPERTDPIFHNRVSIICEYIDTVANVASADDDLVDLAVVILTFQGGIFCSMFMCWRGWLSS